MQYTVLLEKEVTHGCSAQWVLSDLFWGKQTKAFLFSPHTWPGSIIIRSISISKYMEHSFGTLWNVKYTPNTVAENIITDCDVTIYIWVERSDKLGALFSVWLWTCQSVPSFWKLTCILTHGLSRISSTCNRHLIADSLQMSMADILF